MASFIYITGYPCTSIIVLYTWVPSIPYLVMQVKLPLKSGSVSPVFYPEGSAVAVHLQNYVNSQRKDVIARAMAHACGIICKVQTELVNSKSERRRCLKS